MARDDRERRHWPAKRQRPSATRMLMITEGKLLLREPIPLFWGVVFPAILMIVMGLSSASPERDLGGLRLVDTYQPILITFVCAALAVQGMPAALASYRERGMLRRLAVTPVGPSRVLAVQLAVHLGLILTATAGIVIAGRLAFHVALPGSGLAFIIAVVLLASTMLALGLLIAALAPSGRVASAIGAILFFPMMYFAGLWTPRATMPQLVQQISDFTPLGAAVQSLQDSMIGQWPSASALVILAAYATVFGVTAARFFRWQ